MYSFEYHNWSNVKQKKQWYKGKKIWVASICMICTWVSSRNTLFLFGASLSVGPRYSSRVRASVLVSRIPGRRFQLDDASWSRSRATNDWDEEKSSSGPLLLSRWSHSFVRRIRNAGKSHPAKTTTSPWICKSHIRQKREEGSDFCRSYVSVKSDCLIFNFLKSFY